MKLLLLGRDGQVGGTLKRTLGSLGELTAFGRAEADLENLGELSQIVAAVAPDVIVNAAAYTAVDRAESEPKRARLVNAEAVAVLATAAADSGAALIHYSTDYVYDGAKPSPYIESDQAHPLSVYGVSKLEGDAAIAASGCRHLIFRVGWVFAPSGNNFLASILRLAGSKQSLSVVDDQVGAPTSAGFIAAATAAAIAQLSEADDRDSLSGIYHLAAGGTVSRHELAQFVVREAAARGAALALVPEAIRPIATADYPTPAVRPLNSRLDTSRVHSEFGIVSPPWEQDVRSWLTATLAAAA